MALLPTIADAGRARGHGASRGSGGRSTYAQAKHRFELAKKAPPGGRSRSAAPLGREVPRLRTRTARVYRSSDGRYVARVSPVPINFRDAHGRFQPIDNTLVPVPGAGHAVANRANSYSAKLPGELGASPVR